MKRVEKRHACLAGLLCACLLFATAGFASAPLLDDSILAIASGILGETDADTQPAAPTEAVASTFRFSITPVLPENQVDPSVGYFYLKMAPGQTQTIGVSVRNEGSEPVTISVKAASAFTNANGIMQYGEPSTPQDPSMQHSMTELLALQTEALTLAAGETQLVQVRINMPQTPFEGTLLGGLVFVREQTEMERGASGTAIDNVYSYVMPVRLMEADTPIQAVFTLSDVAINTRTTFGPKTVLTVRNTQPVIVKPLTLDYALYAANDLQTPLAEHRNELMEMAPNTAMAYAFRQENTYAPGAYVAKVTLTYQDETTTYEEAITIAAP